MKNRRQVFWALIMMLVTMVAAAVFANVDPFSTELIWANWIGLTIGGMVGIGASLWVAIDLLPDEKNFFQLWLVVLVAGAFVGGFFIGMISEDVDAPYNMVCWYGYFAMLIMYMINGLVAYMAYETRAQRANRRQYWEFARTR